MYPTDAFVGHLAEDLKVVAEIEFVYGIKSLRARN